MSKHKDNEIYLVQVNDKKAQEVFKKIKNVQ